MLDHLPKSVRKPNEKRNQAEIIRQQFLRYGLETANKAHQLFLKMGVKAVRDFYNSIAVKNN